VFCVWVFEDNVQYALMLQKSLEEYRDKVCKDVDVDIDIRVVEGNYLERINEILLDNIMGFNLFILDIDLQESHNGIQLAKKIREKDKLSNIIFISSHIELMSVIFVHNLKVMSFIDKMNPNFESRLYSALDIVKEEMFIMKPLSTKKVEADKVLQYKYKTQLYRVPHSDIIAVETNALKRGLVITTTYNTYYCNMSLKELSKELSDSFVQSHRSILINTDRVTGVKNRNAQYYALMDTNQEYPVSHKYVKQVFSKLTNNME